jgi:hypothetical protein
MFGALDEIVARTRAQLDSFRGVGGSDEEFVGRLIENFRSAAAALPVGSGSAHMAMAVYQLAVFAERIERLEGDLLMRDDALKFMFELDRM